MIVGVIGNCQARELTKCFQRHYSDLEVRCYFSGYEEDRQRVDAEVASLDVVISQWFPDDFPILGTSVLRERSKSFISVPMFSFTGFHPDITYLKENGADFASPVGAYHSRIVAGSYALGLAEKRVGRLFNRFIYQGLGYFDELPKASARFNQVHEKVGFKLSTKSFSVPFMHTVNHPTGLAISLLTKELAEKIGLDTDGWSTEADIAEDGLADDTVWPIYPELARAFGGEGSTSFQITNRKPNITKNPLSLEEFIAGSYEIYAQRQMDQKPIEATVRFLSSVVR